MRRATLSSLLLLAACSSYAVGGDEPPRRRVHEIAASRALPAGAPRASDVIMRALALRQGKDPTQHDTFRALADFHVTRLEWAYIRDKEAIARCGELGILFGGAASSALSHVAMPEGDSDYARLACVDLRGEPVVPTWKRSWRGPGTLWMCVNNPALEERYMEYLKSCIDAGAQVMQRDEPSGNASAISWGGCFCKHCMRAFREHLAGKIGPDEQKRLGIGNLETFDYREMLEQGGAPLGDDFSRYDGGELKQHFVEFQTEATIAFHEQTRRKLDAHAGRRVPMSCNNGCRHWTPIELMFDWCFGELSFSHARADFLHAAIRRAEAFGRCQVVTMPKKRDREQLDAWCRLTRQTIAMAYACGGHCMVPWDVYMPGDAPRYFGTAQQYADLFGFIRASAQYLDGYEYAGALGPGIECDLWGPDPPLHLHGGDRLSAVVRAVPGQAAEPVVVHLVDWSENPQPFRLTLDPAALFGDRPLRIQLLVPVAYSRAQHAEAVETGSYTSLSKTLPLEGGYRTSVSLPALAPWGLLVIEPEEAAKGVWQPVIRTEESDFYRQTIAVRMASHSAGASLHFTLDGSPPGTDSPRYAGPIELSASTVLQGVAVLPDGRTSEVASATFVKLAGVPAPIDPGIPPLRERLQLWLSADSLALPDGGAVEKWPAAFGPDAVAEPQRTFDGRLTGSPTLVARAVGDRPAVRFDGVDDSLAIRGFANRYLAGRGFTLFMVTRSENDQFGICGNGIAGTGGTPRLYMQRSGFRYDELRNVVSLNPAGQGPTISTFMHDGRGAIRAASDGAISDPVSGVAVVPEFGSGGNLAIPFWSGNRNCAGDMAEVLVYDRQLSDEERSGVEAYLADKYSIRYARRWRRE